jgi:hypothetical protein
MWTPGANFAEAIGVQLYLPTEGVRSELIPGALIVLARGKRQGSMPQAPIAALSRRHRRVCNV